MSKLTIVNESPGRVVVEGELIFSAINKSVLNATALLSATKHITVDLAKVNSVDSAGLALLIEWIKVTRSKRVQLHFRNIPEQLLNLAKLSDIDKMSSFIKSQLSEAATDKSQQ